MTIAQKGYATATTVTVATVAQKRLVGLRVAALTQISQRKKAKERERGGRGKGKGGRERELNHYGNMKPDQVYQKIQIERSGFMNCQNI